MPKQHKAPYYLSLIGGILILLASLFSFGFGPSYYARYGYMSNMMGGYYPTMGGYGMMGFSYLPLLGIVSGLVILYGAHMLLKKPKENKTWGILILVFSVVSLGTGGGFLGAILGILGGILTLSEK